MPGIQPETDTDLISFVKAIGLKDEYISKKSK
ncbi:Uncharacterised protein [[Clostridium] sordellii]|uniref:Uncharacterized protein n=1 Tax=Paraclostridium sordellii TaxID=1505 RepID=A0A0C7G657_PARSO|nr:Uncharacterised protein [[Clostridium] sordellii] [Paeniclostridium sordellii]CEQ03934.1 Uncharacterised protein [[Clostridium] sordellii] [Paeniclostridium sordellii]